MNKVRIWFNFKSYHISLHKKVFFCYFSSGRTFLKSKNNQSLKLKQECFDQKQRRTSTKKMKKIKKNINRLDEPRNKKKKRIPKLLFCPQDNVIFTPFWRKKRITKRLVVVATDMTLLLLLTWRCCCCCWHGCCR